MITRARLTILMASVLANPWSVLGGTFYSNIFQGTVNAGSSVTLYVTATGTAPLNYQWRKDGLNISGVPSSGYVMAKVQTAGAGYHDVVVSNANGSVTSAAAILAAQGVSLSVTLSNDDLFDFVHGTKGRYYGGDLYFYAPTPGFLCNNRWQRGVASLGDLGAMAFDQIVPPTTGYTAYGVPAIMGHTYVALIGTDTNAQYVMFRVTNLTSTSVTLDYQVYIDSNQPLGFLVQPGCYRWWGSPGPSATLKVCEADPDTQPLAATAVGLNVTYQWQKDGVDVPGATLPSLRFNNAPTSASGTYRLCISNASGSIMSSPVQVTILPLAAPAFTSQPGPTVSIATGASGTLSYTCTGVPCPRWYPGDVTFYKDGTPLGIAPGMVATAWGIYPSDPSCFTAVLNLTNATQATAGVYTVTLTNSQGTATSSPVTVQIGVPAAPTITSFTPTTITSGMSVTITGMNFTGVTSVQFNGVNASDFSVDSDTQITASVPEGATIGRISVITPNGTATSADDFRCIAYVFTTLAGQGNFGSIDGAASTAMFNNPNGVAVDAMGNLYVADSDNCTIRKITPDGTVTTLAGLAGNAGSADGTGVAARFNYPNGVSVDSGGSVYVADRNSHTIRKITSSGVVTTFAGLAGSSGSADGTGSAARFNWPDGVAVDSGGNVYVADWQNNTIRKITPDGDVSTLAGLAGANGYADGTGTNARFSDPWGVAVDGSGNVYVADVSNTLIRKITQVGEVTTLAGGPGGPSDSTDGVGSYARFTRPVGVAVDGSGNVYVADVGNNLIRKITPEGEVTSIAGLVTRGSTDAAGNAARFSQPAGVAVDSGGSVYVADRNNHTIRKIASSGVVTTFAGLAGSSSSADGTGSAARFNYPSGVAVDSSGNIYVTDSSNHTIRKITPDGTVTTLAGLAGSSGSDDGTGNAARFNYPPGVAVDSGGNIYVADCGNYTIRKITSAGVVTTLAGLAGNAGSADGTGSAARFLGAVGVAVDSEGTVYVAEYNATIRKITSDGVVTTLAGLAGTRGNADGVGSAARFHCPQGVAVDGDGNVYVADAGNNKIRLITRAGVVTTLAGLGGNAGSADGTGGAAQFNNPTGVAVDSGGNVYVGDTISNTIRKGVPVVLPSIGTQPQS